MELSTFFNELLFFSLSPRDEHPLKTECGVEVIKLRFLSVRKEAKLLKQVNRKIKPAKGGTIIKLVVLVGSGVGR